MADDDQFHHSSGNSNWWDTSRNNMRFDQSGTSQTSSSNNIVDFAWQNSDMVDIKPRSSSMDDNSSIVFHDDTQKLQQPQDSSTTSIDPNLHMMGLGLSSHAMDWNQPPLISEKGSSENNLRSMLEENLSSTRNNFEQENMMGLCQGQIQWRSSSDQKLFSAVESSSNEFKQVNNRSFSLDQNQFSPSYSSGESNVTSQGLMDYGTPSILQGLLGSDHSNNIQHQQQQGSFENRPMSFSYTTNNYGLNSNNELNIPSNWSTKVPQFLRTNSPPKQQPPNNQLHFTNNTPFWNASEAANSIKDVRSSFFPSLQPQFSTPNFDSQAKNISEVGVVKKSGSEPAPKRTRNETPSTLPAFKVRKEKMGDRITALQQLVSPFGKTDTASVLSEAIEYIKFLHEQVTVLSTPYMKSGAPTQNIQQNSGKSKKSEGAKQDLRSRGLCLVPVSSTFPVTHETTVDFWTPTFGGTSR
ncbi:uncharacterized protein [Cicer arietinum]|uniref:Transcription factor bHLH123-like isoform X2 n=1 Tax=Cicer arietinum TaxID=3827 RepID=A0A1S2XDH9_CICAR|nr:transcription factor bHLH123-like isoform X2 [Cicer arietinum]